MLLSRVQLLRLAMGAFLLAVTLGTSVMAQEGTTPAETPAPAATTSEPATTDAAAAPEQVVFDTGDTAWMLVSCLLVLMMTAPGLSLFYCGLVRKRNVLSVIMQCMFLMGMMSVVWFIYGYSLAFAPSLPGSMGLVGGFDNLFWKGVVPELLADGKTVFTPANLTTPAVVWAVFQMMFFIITPALICGAYAERMKFSSMVVFSLLWGTFVYCPLAHWVWSTEGWLSEFNVNKGDGAPMFVALDFAGGTVVHISSGISALVCAIMIGKRLGHGHEPMPPHNLTYTSIGTALLWVGWFGFNAGSAGGASTFAVNAFACTHMAAATGLLTWAILEWVMRGHPSILGACTGAVAGLVAITPASGSVTVLGGVMIGLIGTAVSYFACTTLKGIFKYDDALDVFGVHGMAGISGALLTGVFASETIKPDFPGLLEGNPEQMIAQIVSVGAAAGLAVVGSVIILGLINATIGLRVSKDTELQGLDLNEHGEEGYIFV